MSLDFTLTAVRPTTVFDCNVTHNLAPMAREAGIYECLWRPDETGYKTAQQLIEPLRAGLTLLRSDPARFRPLNPVNGFGSYDRFVVWVAELLFFFFQNPDATITACR